ncbi:MAG: flagellar biosynthetic protein FliR [Rhodothalassiaceae bacterium]
MLDTLLPAEIWGFLLVFARMGALLAMIPALGEPQIPQRIRLGLALAVSLLVFLAIRDRLPALPAGLGPMVGLVLIEIMIGLMMALLLRAVFSALNVAGTIAAFQTSLAFSQQVDPAQGTQSAITASFLSMLGLVLIFASDLHLVTLEAMVRSYSVFPLGALPPVDDFASLMTDYVAASFVLGMQIAAPFLVFGVVFNVGLGLIARLMPQLPVFFIGLPLNIFVGFALLMIALPAMMMWFLAAYGQQLSMFVQ